MRSKTSLFNKGLFLNALYRYWPLWAAYALVLFFAVPLHIMGRQSTDAAFYGVSGYIINTAWGTGCIISFIMAAATAMCVFSFLFNARQTGLIASLPLSRSTVFISMFSAGAAAMLAVNLLIFIFTIFAELNIGMLSIGYLWQWLAIMVLMNLTFYGFAAFCAMLTGNIIVLPLVYTVLGLTAWAVETLVRSLLQLFVFGMSSGGGVFNFLSPIIELFSNTPGSYYADSSGIGQMGLTFDEISSGQWLMLGAYALAGLLFAVAALLLYRRRRMETSTDVVAIKVLKPVFKYCLAVGCALVFGVWLYDIVFNLKYSNAAVFIITSFMLAGGFIGYFAADMLMKKTLRVFYGNWKGFVIMSCAIVALMLCCRFDLFGYEKHIPAAQDVTAVTITVDGDPATLHEADNIALVTQLHKSIMSNRAIHSVATGADYADLRMTYDLTNGGSLTRYYQVSRTQAQIDDPDSDINLLQAVINLQEAIENRKATSIEVTEKNISNAGINYYDAETNSHLSYELTAEEAYDLYQNCILPDIKAGALGRVWLYSGSDYYSRVYDVDISMELYDRSGPVNEAEGFVAENYGYFHTTLTTDAANTLAWIAANTNIKPVMAKASEGAGSDYYEKEKAYSATQSNSAPATVEG